jgi:hypothetical protein
MLAGLATSDELEHCVTFTSLFNFCTVLVGVPRSSCSYCHIALSWTTLQDQKFEHACCEEDALTKIANMVALKREPQDRARQSHFGNREVSFQCTYEYTAELAEASTLQ